MVVVLPLPLTPTIRITVGECASGMRGGSAPISRATSRQSAPASDAPLVTRPCAASSRRCSTRSVVTSAPQSAAMSASSRSSQVSRVTSRGAKMPASCGEIACRGLVRLARSRESRPRRGASPVLAALVDGEPEELGPGRAVRVGGHG